MPTRFLSILIALLAAAASVTAEQRTINWQSSNPIFNSSVYHLNHFVVRIGERLRIKCPEFSSEVSMIHRVDREHADLCELPKKGPSTVVGVCRRPGDSILVTFRDYSPLPGGLEFHAGKVYFFITTSTGENTEEGLSNREGGLCHSRNMKVRFLVIRKTQHHRQHQHSGEDENDSHATVPDDDETSNVVPGVQNRPFVESTVPVVVDGDSIDEPPFNAPFHPFGIPPYWPSSSAARSRGTVSPLMSDSARPGDGGDGSVDWFGGNQIQEGVDFKVEYRYDDVSATSALRPTIGLLLAFAIFLIFSNR